MAGVSVIEDRGLLPVNSGVNVIALVQNFFQAQGYAALDRQSPLLQYYRLYKFSSRVICDIIILYHCHDVESAGQSVNRLDSEYMRLKRAILHGKLRMPDLQPKAHHFLTLHKKLVRYSYNSEELSVGFQIRPLITVEEQDQWDFFAGSNRRVDVISSDPRSLTSYLERHRQDIKSTKARMANLSKFTYWKYSNYLLDYGHIPLIILWMLKFVFSIVQVPFLFDLNALITLTIVSYSCFIAFAYTSYSLFKRIQINEMEDSFAATTTPGLNIRESIENNASTSLYEDNNPPQSVNNTALNSLSFIEPYPDVKIGDVNRFYRSRITRQIRKILRLRNIKELNLLSSELFRDIFFSIFKEEGQTVPKSACLSDLLKQARGNPGINHQFRSIKLWIAKLETQTPFDSEEALSVKSFFLRLLYELKLLPADLKQILESEQEGVMPPVPSINQPESNVNVQLAHDPPSASVLETDNSKISKLEAEIEQLKRLVASGTKEVEPILQPKTTLPNLEVDSLPQIFHPNVSEMNELFFTKIQESELNGRYCIVIVDIKQPDATEIISQFYLLTKDLDVSRRTWWDINRLGEYSLEKEFANVIPPAILIGCGKSHQVIPYDSTQAGIQRLHSILDSYLVPSTRPTLKLRGRDEDLQESLKDTSKSNEPLEPNSLQNQNTPFEQTPNENPLQLEQSSLNKQINRKLLLDENLKNIKRGSIIIDGSNVAYLLSDKRRERPKQARLSCVLGVIKVLIKLGLPGESISVFFDANIEQNLPEIDRGKLGELLKNDLFYKVPSGDRADTAIIQWAETLSRQFLVISRDRYKKEEPSWFRSHRIGVMLDPENRPLLIFKSIKDLIAKFYGEMKE